MDMDHSRAQEINDLYTGLLNFETANHPFDMRFQQAMMMHKRFGGGPREMGHHNHHEQHNMQDWANHIDQHFRGPLRDVMETIQAHPQINAHGISDALDILPGTLSKYLKRLISRRLVDEQTNPENRREKFYSLTDAGTWLLSLAHGIQDDDKEAKENVADEFSPEEQDVIVRFLVAMRHRNDNADSNRATDDGNANK
ncbi:winged helix DNA-binding protein [Furfurilactobacillus rossiae]|uniref:HTH marR-type domain-containing protein n=2 Tax=Furfurilactobacillus rossiae TaxID=231049 RepID=A0A0R1R912_9LACO|nr:hypothetical protein FD35_GL001011 [Furfurilactobacillus rossiae DSM 15814]QFR67493.1 winged helix DNA-binding protein [Furfurilactobacillus rossiae]